MWVTTLQLTQNTHCNAIVDENDPRRLEINCHGYLCRTLCETGSMLLVCKVDVIRTRSSVAGWCVIKADDRKHGSTCV